jgi:hypothetical protein
VQSESKIGRENLSHEWEEALANWIAGLVLQKMDGQNTNKQDQKRANESDAKSIRASNLLEYVQQVPELEIFGNENDRILRCNSCSEFLSSPASFTTGFRQPTGRSSGSIAKGLHLPEELYQQLIVGKNDKWYHQKEHLNSHVLSKTHVLAVEYMKGIEKCDRRKATVVKNQLRTAIGIVKSKAAAIQYEARIAELQAAGADVGDFGHSRKLFPEMLKVFLCSY